MRLRRHDALPPDAERELEAIDAALAGESVAPALAELEGLVLTARDDRPRPANAFIQRLDERARAGFPPDRDTPRRALAAVRARLHRRVLLPALGAAATVFLAVVALTSVLGGGDSSKKLLPGSGPPARDESRTGEGAAGAPAGALAIPAEPPRRVERQAVLTLEAAPDRVDDLSQRVIRITDGVNGVVANSTVSSGDGDGGASFELRIPGDRLPSALSQLSKLAHVRSRQEGSRDVTNSFDAAKGRLDQALAERSSLLRQLAAAATPNRAESVRARLRINAQRIAQARSGVNDLRRRTTFATVQLTIEARKDRSGVGGGRWTADDALGDATRVLEISLGVLVVAVAVSLPLAVIVALAGVAARALRRRRREQSLASG